MLPRSSFPASWSPRFRSEKHGHNALLMIANLCFSVFVIGVGIFTIMALTYKPRPFVNPTSKIANSLSSDSNPTFKSVNNGVVNRGEGFVASDYTAFSDIVNLTEVGFEEDPNAFPENSGCGVDVPIKCRDPDVFHLLMSAAIDKFKDIHFYRFGKPVAGDNGTSCHMAWRFRPKEGKETAFNKDYRSFTLVRSENCTLSVVHIGDYHSGGNARMRKGKGNGKGKEMFGKIPPKEHEIGGTANGSLPTIESEGPFSQGKYLIYSGGGDRCKSMNQYLWSFMCMLGEAQFLNRTLAIDLSICLSKIYSSSGVDEEGKDFRFYFDFEHLKDSASVIDQAHFWSDWNKWKEREGLTLQLVEDFRVTPMKLAEVRDTLIMRKFGSVEPDNYWYRVCEGEAENVIQRPWGMIRKARSLFDIVSAITARMGWNFDAVHVERGEKARNKELWPNLDRDTSPNSLLAKLKDKVEDGKNLYVATDEQETSFFDPLKNKYATHFLDDHKDLWAAKSDWYYELMKLNDGNSVEFDGYMRTSVDSEVFIRGEKQIETFNYLTKDCKYGVNRC